MDATKKKKNIQTQLNENIKITLTFCALFFSPSISFFFFFNQLWKRVEEKYVFLADQN